MQPLRVLWCLQFFAKGGDEGGDNDGVLARGLGQRGGIDLDLHRGPLDCLGADLGDQALSGLRLGKGTPDEQHRPQLCRVGKERGHFAVEEQVPEHGAVVDGGRHENIPLKVSGRPKPMSRKRMALPVQT